MNEQKVVISEESYYERIANDLIEIITSKPRGIIILGGGNSPRKINDFISHELGKSEEFKNHFFKNFKIFLSDERFVSLGDELSNSKMLRETLTGETTSLISMKTDLPFEECVSEYQNRFSELSSDFPIVFSLLGVGDDGHTASLFPGQFGKTDQFVIDGGVGPEGERRISLSHKALLLSEKIGFIVNTQTKWDAVHNSKSIQPLVSSKTLFYLSEGIE